MPKNKTKDAQKYWVGVSLIALSLSACYVYIWRNAFNFTTAIDVCSKPFCDFATY